jgi:5-methyltetrahydropteroyltriglutamate--homocysteine methyltransferase
VPEKKAPKIHRAEHVGSFLRPQRLVEAARQAKAGQLDAEGFRSVQDECIREIVAFQEGLGFRTVTDGEFRRRSWSAGFIDAVEGFGLREGTLGFRTKSGKVGVAPSPYAKQRIRRTRGIATEEFRFLKSVTGTTPKVTMPAPDVMHFFLGPQSVDESVYPDIEDYFADLVSIYREEVSELAALGCNYIQLDDTALPCNCDESAREGIRARGENPATLTATYVRLANEVLSAGADNMTKVIHMCRGNLKGAWMAEGGYESIAEKIFGELNVDAFFLEYDTPRAGDFLPLRFVPSTKKVVLGLICTKTPVLENPDQIKRRIDDASRFVALDRLCLSPQCGFSSGAGGGQPITHDDEQRKLELVRRIASDVWGEGG